MTNFFPGKILLYGEYSIVLKNKALAVPIPFLGGKWENATLEDNKSLIDWLEYLKKLPNSFQYHLNYFEEALTNGLIFNSNIPQGYGAGSSGALVAAYYSRFSKKPDLNLSTDSLRELKKELGLLESYFHGNSSGTDPLVSYLQCPLLISSDCIDQVNLPSSKGDMLFFLLDCGMARKTEPLVKRFLHDINTKPDYKYEFENQYIQQVEQSINSHLAGDFYTLKKQWQALSRLQLHFFNSMIPTSIQDAWKKGNEEGHTHLKLCGAGGGGYLLGLSALKEEQVSLFYPNFKIIPLPFL